jgi:acyl-CoA synthetase (AMP-forming)/AMP-acid ligase II
VVLFIKRKIDYIQHWFATLKIGAIAVSVQPKTFEDLQFYIQDTSAHILVTDSPSTDHLQLQSLRFLVTLEPFVHEKQTRYKSVKSYN